MQQLNDLMEGIQYKYNFKFDDGTEKLFNINLDPKSLSLIDESVIPPEWARLKNFRCSHCPLSQNNFEFCPLASSLASVINDFSEYYSFDNVELTISTEEREFRKNTSLQDGVRSMLGIIMVTCGCPVMGKLKPMARFHLPFSTLEETQFRYFSTYILAQYFVEKNGGTPDWKMEKLKYILEDIRTLNINVSRKIAELEVNDTTINSVVILNNFTDYIGLNLDEESLNEVEVLFKDYLEH